MFITDQLVPDPDELRRTPLRLRHAAQAANDEAQALKHGPVANGYVHLAGASYGSNICGQLPGLGRYASALHDDPNLSCTSSGQGKPSRPQKIGNLYWHHYFEVTMGPSWMTQRRNYCKSLKTSRSASQGTRLSLQLREASLTLRLTCPNIWTIAGEE